MDIKEALLKYRGVEVELILMHLLGKSKEFIFMNLEYRMSENQIIRLRNLVKRRKKGQPLAYILGYKDFYGLRLKVNKHVLIPRPETEMAVDLVIERLKNFRFKDLGGSIKILDVGTGSGAIITGLADRAKGLGFRLEFYASDVSKKALNIAKSNFVKHRVKARIILSDLLKNIKFDFDILIANLPYLDPHWRTDSVKYDPKTALFTKEKGLFLYRKLLEQILVRHQKPALIYLEFDPRQKPALRRLIKKHLPKADVNFHKDFAGRFRYAEISWRRSLA
ncbi:MAG: peptide chain release factor N(5)-glutamine methyltransferase [Patescibacteria group bacterium]|nr:peptide chain release factor N(5)-glutamine methyltransferase [Patescibacteria group bacterium]